MPELERQGAEPKIRFYKDAHYILSCQLQILITFNVSSRIQ